MSIKRISLFIVLAVVLLLALILILRAAGVVALNSCQTAVESEHNHVTEFAQVGREDIPYGYQLTILIDGETVSTTGVQVLDAPQLPITLDLSPEIAGTPGMPLRKIFSISYNTTYHATSSDGRLETSGTLNGASHLTVSGFCSRQRALEIAHDEIIRQLEAFFEEQFESNN